MQYQLTLRGKYYVALFHSSNLHHLLLDYMPHGLETTQYVAHHIRSENQKLFRLEEISKRRQNRQNISLPAKHASDCAYIANPELRIQN